MRKRFLVIASLVLLSYGAVGCGENTAYTGNGQEGTEQQENTQDQTEPQESKEGETEKQENTGEQTEKAETTEQQDSTENVKYSTKEEVEAYKKTCQPANFDYNNLMRYEENYKGNDYVFTVSVAQIMNDGKEIRAYCDDTHDIIIEDMREYDTVKILQDDNITVYGNYVGAVEITRSINDSQEQVPCFRMYAADIAGVTDTEYYGTDMSNIDYASIYGDILADSAVNSGFCNYSLYDLNQDGRKEMLVCTGSCEADALTTVYTVDEIGAVSSVGSFYGNLMYYVAEDGNGLYGVYGHMGVETVYSITMSGGNVSCVELWSKEVEEYYENNNYVPYAEGSDYSLLQNN